LGLKDIFELLNGKWDDGTRPKDIYELYISKNPEEYVEKIIEGLQSDTRKVQSGCAELASLLSEHNPELLYSHIDLFLKNLDAKAPVLRWEAVCTLGNLASVDKKKKNPKASQSDISSSCCEKYSFAGAYCTRISQNCERKSKDCKENTRFTSRVEKIVPRK
jgi:hypothetical protein